MLDDATLWQDLARTGLAGWRSQLEPLIHDRLQDTAHGDFARWRGVLEDLRSADTGDSRAVRELLLALSPWRKGPFEVAGITIDSEWRSNLKWDRIKNHIEPLEGRDVLDVGAGNGYYALEMSAAGAGTVVGIDPTLLYVVQFLAVAHFVRPQRVHVLPLRLEELPAKSHSFDTTFSMGVLYHQRSPIDHLRALRDTLRPGGELVLETLFVPGRESYASTPPGRYARMRNVWFLPTVAELTTWLRRSRFDAIEVISESVTTTDEQRSTAWMRFESLREALEPDDPDRTIEGWPAPRRVAIVAKAP